MSFAALPSPPIHPCPPQTHHTTPGDVRPVYHSDLCVGMEEKEVLWNLPSTMSHSLLLLPFSLLQPLLSSTKSCGADCHWRPTAGTTALIGHALWASLTQPLSPSCPRKLRQTSASQFSGVLTPRRTSCCSSSRMAGSEVGHRFWMVSKGLWKQKENGDRNV